MPIGHEYVFPSVFIRIQKKHAPSQQLVGRQPCLLGKIAEELSVLVVIEGRQVAGEVGFHNVEKPVAVIVSHCHSHPSLSVTVKIVGDSGGDAALLESPVPAVS